MTEIELCFDDLGINIKPGISPYSGFRKEVSVVELKKRHCVPCEGEILPMQRKEAEKLLLGLSGWTLEEDSLGGFLIAKTFRFRDFRNSWAFCEHVASLAEEEGHHPDFLVRWNLVTLELSTHAIGGLSENDFIMAAKIEDLQTPR